MLLFQKWNMDTGLQRKKKSLSHVFVSNICVVSQITYKIS